MKPISRREALRQSARVAAAAALWAGLPGRTWAALPEVKGWSAEDERRLTLIGDTIIPATSGSPGAGAVGIGRFIVTMTEACHPPEAAEAVRRALREVEAESVGRHGKAWAGLPASEREAVLLAYEKRAAAETRGRAINPFRHVKELTLLGYFTSEPGATQALRYDPVPGTYRGSVPLAEGERSWAI